MKIDNSTIPPEMEDQVRCICYDFGDAFLQLRTIGTTLTFSIGDNELQNFRMIERHYFRDQLIKSYDFNFGFVIPNSTNTWEAIYEMPELDPELMEDMIKCVLPRAAAACPGEGSLSSPPPSCGALTPPPLSPRFRDSSPWETQSDSFYYVGDEMVLHNKAKYAYSRPA